MTSGGDWDCFVTKMNATGSTLIYSTFLGRNGGEHCGGIAVEQAGNAYLTGYTLSPDFPVTPGAFQSTFSGHQENFVSKLNAAGSALLTTLSAGQRPQPGGSA